MSTKKRQRAARKSEAAGSDWPPPCPHCGERLLTSEDRGLHCDGCDQLSAEDIDAILVKFTSPNAGGHDASEAR